MTESNKVSKVQLSLHAQKLKNVAGAFKGTSDPYAVVTLVASSPGEKPEVVGKTEVIKNDLSPHWTKTFDIKYTFGKPQKMNVSIFDRTRKRKEDMSMGSAIFEIGEVLGSRGNIKAKKLKNGGTIFCRISLAPEEDLGTFSFALRGVKLKNVDGLFGKSDPFFEVSRLINAGGGPTWQAVYRSKPVMNDLSPKWEPVTLRVSDLCGGDKSKTILITVKDWEKNGKHNAMGYFETSLNGLLAAKTSGGSGNVKNIDLSKAFKLTRKGKNYGSIVVTSAVLSQPTSTPSSTQGSSSAPAPAPVPVASTGFGSSLDAPPKNPSAPYAPSTGPSSQGATEASVFVSPIPAPTMGSYSGRPKFVEYLSGGLELQLSVAIDFTGSNGDPRKPGTLHYIHRDGQLNDYEKALSAVGAIVGKYDSDQKFPVLGFGAKYGGIINHCFQVGHTREVSGIKGMLDAYRRVFKSGIVMSGPTVFADVIGKVSSQARMKQQQASRIGNQHYEVLLILTDGAVTDINMTRDSIRRASDAPLSIVIVGIGHADFSAMQFLDDFQDQEKGSGGRDIVQFVEFQKYRDNKIRLTQATLDEIPDQVVNYFHSKGIKPQPPVHGSKLNIVPDEYNEDEEIDLNLDISEDGEVNLAGGGYKDETGYGDYHTFASPPLTGPSAPPTTQYGQPPAAYQPQHVPGMNQPGFAPQPSQAQPGYHPGGTATPPYHPTGGATTPPYHPTGGATTPPYHPASGAAHFGGVNPAYSPTPGGVNPVPGYGQGQAHPVQMPAYSLINVQVPPGAIPGTQIPVQNPTTGQLVMVTVPPGIQPGQTFAVSL